MMKAETIVNIQVTVREAQALSRIRQREEYPDDYLVLREFQELLSGYIK